MSNVSPVKRFHSQCINCLLNKHLGKADLAKDDDTRLEYMQGLFKILSEASQHEAPPEVIDKITRLQKKLLGFEENFENEKKYFNTLMLAKENLMQGTVDSADDRLHTALNFAMLGNYIDFGAMDSVSEDKLDQLLATAKDLKFDNSEYDTFKCDLSKAHRLIYLTDNCGEIVADKIFIKTILQEFPQISAEVIVKGNPVLNDATLEDALQIDLNSVVKVSHNSSGLAGTVLGDISDQALKKLDSADIIIAKGQANFETLRHCGKNIYYIFMCKCKLFADRFNLPKFSGMLLNDLRM